MVKLRAPHAAIVGVAEHGNSAVLVTVAVGGEFLDRRSIALTRDLPTHPYHHEGSWAVGRYLTSSWARPTSPLPLPAAPTSMFSCAGWVAPSGRPVRRSTNSRLPLLLPAEPARVRAEPRP